MNRKTSWNRRTAAFGFLVAALGLAPGQAEGACNLIPGTAKTFGSALGAANRPFAAPGEPVELRLRGCEASRSAFRPTAQEHVATVAFKPTGGPARLVVLAPNCALVPTAACGPTPITCRTSPLRLTIDPDLGDRRLTVLFPDTDAELAPAGDGLTLSGPAAIAVTAVGQPLPCGLATTSCANTPGLLACVDELFLEDGACGTTTPNGVFPSFTALPNPNVYAAACFSASPPCDATASTVRVAVDSAGNLLTPFVWQGVLVRDAGVPVPRLMRARLASPVPLRVPDQVFLGSFTPEGGRLPPILEPQADTTVFTPNVVTLFGSVDAPYTVLQLARRHGICAGGSNAAARCTTDGDCLGGTCRTSCVDAPGTLCTTDAECATGRCGVLFDAAPLVAGGGSLVLPRLAPQFCQLPPHAACGGAGDCPGAGDTCVSYALEAQNPVPLEGLAASTAARTFTVRESIDAVDRNGDGDITDTVITLRNRASGLGENLGAAPGCGIAGTPEGRAVVRVLDPPFSFPAVAVEGDVVAFLESESTARYCDQNGDGDRTDALLRVFRLGGGERTAGITPARAVDAAPRINGASLAVSNGRVFVRTSEAAMARQTTERVSVGDDGSEGNQPSRWPSISDDGRLVAFESDATNLVLPIADTNNRSDAFVRDRVAGTTRRATLTVDGAEQTGFFFGGSEFLNAGLSGDGSALAWTTRQTNLLGPLDTNGVTDVFVRDLGVPTTSRISVATDGTQGDFGSSGPIATSADGRIVAFASLAGTLLGPGGDTNGATDVFVADRCVAGGLPVAGCTPSLERVSNRPDGTQSAGGGVVSQGISVSANGRFVVWTTLAEDILPEGDENGAFPDVVLHDRLTGTTELVGRTASGGQPITGSSSSPGAVSADGRFVVFHTADAGVLGPGEDTNGVSDVFLRDRLRGLTTRVSVATGGFQTGGFGHFGGTISPDGRWIAFQSTATDLLGPGFDDNDTQDTFLHDRVTGSTDRVSVRADGTGSAFGTFATPRVAADGRHVVFESDASDLLGPGVDGNGLTDVFVRGVDRSDPFGIDALLFPDGALDDTVLETFDPASGTITTLCPAGDVAVADGNAAFLRPESATGTVRCPGGSLNADGDLADAVVQLSLGSAVPVNLGRAATAVGISSALVAALVSEAADGGVDYNGDGDATDTVVQTHPLGTGAWTNVGQAADTLAVAGQVVAFLTPEAAQGADRNGDGDLADRVIQLQDASVPRLVALGQAAEELVLGERTGTTCGDRHLVAFRTSEAAQGGGSLNGDGDADDAVMQVYDVVTDTLFATGQAATPCRLEACDPRLPYRVNGGTVVFLALEAEQNEDLDGNGEIAGLVIQSFDVCSGVVTTIGTVDPDTGTTTDPLDVIDDGRVFGAPGGRCAVTPAATCDPLVADACPTGTFCNGTTTRCTLLAPATCTNAAPCPEASECLPEIVTVATTTADRDGDGVADDRDICPDVADPLQEDTDGDGVGNACDMAPGCTAQPISGCRAAPPGRSDLTIRRGSDEARDFVSWRWSNGPATPLAAFGDPTTRDGFALCIYQGTPGRVALASAVAAGGMCRGSLRERRASQPCWTATRTGFRYENGAGTPQGLVRATLQAPRPERAKIRVRGQGANLPAFQLPLATPIQVQLQGTNGECWEATFGGAGLRRNDAMQVQGLND